MARIKLVFTLSSVSLLLAAVTYSALPERDPFAGLKPYDASTSDRTGALPAGGSSAARPSRVPAARPGVAAPAQRARGEDAATEGLSIEGVPIDPGGSATAGAEPATVTPSRTRGVLARVLSLVLPPRSESVKTVPLAPGDAEGPAAEAADPDTRVRRIDGTAAGEADPSRTVAILAKADRSRSESARITAVQVPAESATEAGDWFAEPPEGYDADWYAPAPGETGAVHGSAEPDGRVALVPLRRSPRRGAGDDLSWYDSLGAPADAGTPAAMDAPAGGLLDALLADDDTNRSDGRIPARRAVRPSARRLGTPPADAVPSASAADTWVPATRASFSRYRLVKLSPAREPVPAPRTPAAPPALSSISLPLPVEERTPAITVASLGPSLPGRGATTYLGLAEPRPEPTPKKTGFCPLGSVEKRTKSERWCTRKDKGGVAFREGPVAFLYPNGKKQAVGTYAGGRLHGEFVEYAQNGRKIAEGSYRKGKRHGAWTFWWPNGKRQSKGSFVAGDRSGVWTYYDEKGRKISHGELRTIARVEKKQGRWVFWHPNGRKAEEGVFRAGRKEGAWKRFDESGRLLSTVLYRDGVEEF